MLCLDNLAKKPRWVISCPPKVERWHHLLVASSRRQLAEGKRGDTMNTQARKDFEATELIMGAGIEAALRRDISTETASLVVKLLVELSAYRGQLLATMFTESLK